MTTAPLTGDEYKIVRARGDTFPFTFTIKDATGVVENITGWSARLTVDPSDEPVDDSNNLFELTGTIAVGSDGVVSFEPNAVQADQAIAEYYYDLELTDGAGKIRTSIKETFEFVQDISK